jgi:hydroxyacyl-ACP dehydratase HTD2-like protein with hotdog domain
MKVEQRLYFEDVREGQELEPAVREASRTQLFLFSAATWNPHRIHYDREFAASEGHPDVLVHGPLQGAWLAQYVTDWMGPKGRLLSIEWQNRGRAFPDAPLTFSGRVAGVDGGNGTVTLELAMRDVSGAVLLPGKAEVRLPRRS